MCTRYNTLPEAGGVYDQDYTTMREMTVSQNTYAAVARLRSLQGAKIHSLSDSERRLLRYLMENQLWQM